MLLIWDEKMPKILNLPAQLRDEEDEKMNIDETPGTEKLCPRQRRQKMLVLPGQMKR